MHECELKQRTKSVLAFFRELHGKVDTIMSELIKNCDNRVPRLVPSRVDLKNVSGIIHRVRSSTSIHSVNATRCNSLILEGLRLDRFCAFLLVSPLISSRLTGCGKTIWVRWNFTGLHVWDNKSSPRRMLKEAVQQGRSERRGEAYASVR